jgi:hypothetical protein
VVSGLGCYFHLGLEKSLPSIELRARDDRSRGVSASEPPCFAAAALPAFSSIVVGGKKFYRVSGKLKFVLFAPLRGFDYSFGKNLPRCTRVSRPSKSAAGFLNPVPSVIQRRCKHLNSFRIKNRLRVNKLSDFNHRIPLY